MSIERRTADRRRRVLYSAQQVESSSTGDLARLREARRPVAVYGSRVHRRLRARWFSLVPVRRSTMSLVATSVIVLCALLCIGHYAAVAWPSVAYRPEIARPLRLDRSDSFGRWLMVAMLAGAAGASFLIYQLRRHRNDDFAGRYRLWRIVITVALLASLQSIVSIIDWCGALMDLAFGQRVALSGSDWIGLVVMFGGAILALQILVELRRCRVAFGAFTVGLICWLVSESATWNVLDVTTPNRWVLVTVAPLIATTAFFLTTVVYLRMLYREVRQIEDTVSIRERWQKMRQSLFDQDPDEPVEAAPKRERKADKTAARRKSKATDGKESRRKQNLKVRAAEPKQPDAETQESDEENRVAPAKAKKEGGWFRRKKQATAVESGSAASDDTTTETPKEKPKKKRRGFSLRLAPPNMQDSNENESSSDADTSESDTKAAKKRGNWLRKKKSDADASDGDASEELTSEKTKRSGWLRRKKSDDSEDAAADTSDEAQDKPRKSWLRRKSSTTGTDDQVENERAADSSSTATAADDPIDPDEIDWSSMSKSERRRLRKQLKRQNRAA